MFASSFGRRTFTDVFAHRDGSWVAIASHTAEASAGSSRQSHIPELRENYPRAMDGGYPAT
jgi:hypothetical protein